jgi:hypothetical protein
MTTPTNGTGGSQAPPGAQDQTVQNNDSRESEIKQFLGLMFRDGDVFEVRVPNCRAKRMTFTSTVSGYYQGRRVADAARLLAALDATGRAPAIYVTMNPVSSELLARCPNTLKDKVKVTTSDHDIVRRAWMLIDCDPCRPADISSTARELETARLKADAIHAYLTSLGWPEPVMVMSGNGCHLLYRIDLPTDDGGLVERVLNVLAAKFDDDAVKIDRSVHNASRITKVAGTMAANKGVNLLGFAGLEDRPHRRAGLVSVPKSITPVTRELLEALATERPEPAPRPAPRSQPPKSPSTRRFERFSHTPAGVRGYLESHGITVKGEKRDDAGTWLYLDRCPVVADCESTGDSDIGVFVGDDGAIGYKNCHNRGEGLRWLEVRESFEPGYRAFAEFGGKCPAGPSPWLVTVGAVRILCHGQDEKGKLIVSASTEDAREIALDKVDRNSSLSRGRFTKCLVGELNLDDEQVKALDAALRTLEPPPRSEPGERHAHPPREELLAKLDERRQEALDAMPPDVVMEAEKMLKNPGLIDLIVGHIASVGVVGEEVLGITLYIQGVSRLLHDPVSIIIQGTSSSGKSYIIIRVARLFPPGEVVFATDITPNALYYMPPGALMNKWVVAGERTRDEDPEKADGKRALREMISASYLSKMIPLKQGDGSFVSVLLEQHGPIAFVESTTATRLLDEDANRCMLLSTDETPEQTGRIVKAAAAAAREDQPNTARIVLVHQALQLLLHRVNVRVPFADTIAAAMPTQRPEARRAINQVISVIRAVAVLHQRQRQEGQVNDGDPIDATIDDYVVARRLLSGPLGRSLGGSIPDAVARFGRRLTERYIREMFTSTKALEDDEILNSKGKVNEYLRALSDAGVVECVGDHKGSKPSEWQVVGPVPESGAAWLPTIDQISRGAS